MKHMITSPGSYVQGAGELGNLAEHCRMLGNGAVYMIVDKFINDTYHGTIVGSFDSANVPYTLAVFGGECCDPEINRHIAALNGAEVVVGIGGGKTLDTAKAVAHTAGLRMLIVPTAASTDAPCSRLSVVYTENGEFDHYLPLQANPDMVLMDTAVIAAAPARFLAAGMGDAMATWYEAAACERKGAVTLTGGLSTHGAMALARLCREVLMSEGEKAYAAVQQKCCTPAVEAIVEANTYLSGVGFESGGLAAAHAIHNGLTVLPQTHRMLHGEKVAFGVLAQLVLENAPLEEFHKVQRFFRAVHLPVTLAELGVTEVTDAQLLAVGEAACAENDTMGNMPFEVTPQAVAAALRVADAMGREQLPQ